MILEGFKCDECGATSAEKPGDWLQVSLGDVKPGAGFGPGFVFHQWTPGTHYCQTACLIAAASKWKVR